jgi:hypothetical protein
MTIYLQGCTGNAASNWPIMPSPENKWSIGKIMTPVGLDYQPSMADKYRVLP